MAELLTRERNVSILMNAYHVPGTTFSHVILKSLRGREYNSYEEIISADEQTKKSASNFQIRI